MHVLHIRWQVLPQYTVLLFLSVWACGCARKADERQATEGAPRIERLDPKYTVEGAAFNQQPGGGAALAIAGSHFSPSAVVLWNGRALKTGVNPEWVAAAVPAELYEAAGTAAITIRNVGGQTSNALEFRIYPKTGPAPEITSLYPQETAAGTPFNVQPNGDSALGVDGRAFLPGAVIHLDGKPQQTGFRSEKSVSCTVPRNVFVRAREVRVTVENADGKRSKAAVFRVR